MIYRHATPRVLDALKDTPVVHLQGARQTGKSTLVESVASDHSPRTYLTLDTSAVRSAAEADPEGFIAGIDGPVIIDEIQRVPALALAIKSAVDKDRQAGRFLLTGSANFLSVPKLSESLAGRLEICLLWPFSQGEISGARETFIDRMFAAHLSTPEAPPGRPIIERICLGGFPEVQLRSSARRRDAWFESYLDTMTQRDIRELANIEQLFQMRQLLALLATRAGHLVNYADLSRSIGTAQTTLKRYVALLETTFLVRLLPAWYSNIGRRLTKAPKLFLTDSALLVHLLGIDENRLRGDRTAFGRVLENFVAMELTKQLGWSEANCRLYHFRTEAGAEVDLVLEDSSGRGVGIEVKGSHTLGQDAMRGLEVLAEVAGPRFVRGVVLYSGETVVPYGSRLHAVPLSQIWSS